MSEKYWNKFGKPVWASQVVWAKVENFFKSMIYSSGNASTSIMLTQEEYNHLLNQSLQLVCQYSSSKQTATLADSDTTTILFSLASHSSPWLIDLRASPHMTGKSSIFSNHSNMSKHSYIIVTNSTTSQVLGEGMVYPVLNFSLSSMLYIPNFPVNLSL